MLLTSVTGGEILRLRAAVCRLLASALHFTSRCTTAYSVHCQSGKYLKKILKALYYLVGLCVSASYVSKCCTTYLKPTLQRDKRHILSYGAT